tara:strand:+ start:517 stop:1851 length:1335 start_codon:yes stop_codon:yes gene_type:complete
MQADLPKTINEAIKILAYNDFLWPGTPIPPKTKINPHHKDQETVRSLAEAQYAWTEKQARLAVVILKRYLTKFQSHNMDIKALLDKPQYDQPFRVISFEKSIEKFIDEDEQSKIEVRFPYNKKIIQLIRMLKDERCLPAGYARYDGEHKKWTFLQTDVTTYYLTLIAIRYDFKFIDKTLLDDYYAVRKEIDGYRKPNARMVDNEIILDNASESLQDYWNTNVKHLPLIQQLDTFKNLGISTKGIKVKSWSGLGGLIAKNQSDRMWINRMDYTKDQVMSAVTELNCFPLVMTVIGDPSSTTEAQDWQEWLNTFSRHGIKDKNLAFGFDMREPKRVGGLENPRVEKWCDKMEEDLFQTLCELWQLSKQFKYVDKETKVLFVRNRIPKTLMRSGIKPKACLVAIGGGYYTAGTDNLKRYLDSLPKTLYYNDHQPSSYDWHDRIIIKL